MFVAIFVLDMHPIAFMMDSVMACMQATTKQTRRTSITYSTLPLLEHIKANPILTKQREGGQRKDSQKNEGETRTTHVQSVSNEHTTPPFTKVHMSWKPQTKKGIKKSSPRQS